MQQRCFARNLTKVLFVALKDKKALTTIMKENLRFRQLRVNYLNNNNKKEHLRLVISLIRVAAVSVVLEQLTVV